MPELIFLTGAVGSIEGILFKAIAHFSYRFPSFKTLEMNFPFGLPMSVFPL